MRIVGSQRSDIRELEIVVKGCLPLLEFDFQRELILHHLLPSLGWALFNQTKHELSRGILISSIACCVKNVPSKQNTADLSYTQDLNLYHLAG